MIVSERIILKVTCGGNPVEGIVFQLSMGAPSFLNSYPIITVKSDSEGGIEISREDLLHQVEAWKSGMPMDFNGNLDEMDQEVKIDLFNLDRHLEKKDILLNWRMVEPLELKHLSNEELYNYYAEASNKKYRPFSENFTVSENVVSIDLQILV